MKKYNCFGCQKDLSEGFLIITRSNIYPEHIRYIHCTSCGKSHLLDLETGELSSIEYSEDIEDDIIQGLNGCINYDFKDEETEHLDHVCSCNDTPCGNCTCKH